PMLGLDSPRNGRLRITRPDGRVAKSLDVVVQPQPVVIVHQETIGQPTPAGPSDQTPTYAGDGAQD
ncbi:MAG: hypothetical protein KDA37_12925, partial [Planctomycetales bacterium]|nr:hypothetical protein [Planctomycetales bacterium]